MATTPLSINDRAKDAGDVQQAKLLSLNDGYHTTLGSFTGAYNDRASRYLEGNTWDSYAALTWDDLSTMTWDDL